MRDPTRDYSVIKKSSQIMADLISVNVIDIARPQSELKSTMI